MSIALSLGMGNNSNNLTWRLPVMMLLGVLVSVATPELARAQTSDPSRGLWMSTSAAEASLAGRGFGRLSLVDGALAYHSPNFAWRLPFAEIRRLGPSDKLSNALEIESVSGQVYYVGILDGQLTITSPGKAMQMIQRAVRTAPAPVQARPAIAAGGGAR